MDLLPIPYFGMIMSLVVAPVLTFGFIILLRKNKSRCGKIETKKRDYRTGN
jgi:hypothetical protein